MSNKADRLLKKWNIIRNGRVIVGPCTLREVDRWIDDNSMLVPDVDYTIEEMKS